MTVAHTTRAHAKLSPSAAHRWMECPGSIRLSEGIITKSSAFADEGTAAHTLGELCLRTNTDPVDYLGGHVNIKTGKVSRNPGEGDGIFEIDDEMADAVGVYVETVRSLIEPGDEVEYEVELDLTHIPGMKKGTGDVTVYKPAKRHLIIVDLKYGKGVAVSASGNPQERTYALGATQRYHNRGVDTVECVVVQPRCPLPGDNPPGVRREIIDAVELLEFRFELAAAAAETMKPDAPLKPGDWCKFCPAAAGCPALRSKVEAVAELEFAPADLEPEKMAGVLRQAGLIKDWLKAVEERANQMARDGSPPAGFKLVANRATRRWKDEAAAVAFCTAVLDLTDDDIYVEPKVKSPAQMEKAVGSKRKSELSGLIVSKSSGTILVAEEDPRPAVKVDAEKEFAA